MEISFQLDTFNCRGYYRMRSLKTCDKKMPETGDESKKGGGKGFWGRVNEELKKAVEEGWSAFKESARTGKLRYQKHTLHKKAEKNFAEIGGIVYDMAKPPWENPFSKPEILRLVEGIRKIEAEVSALEEEIEKIKTKEKI